MVGIVYAGFSSDRTGDRKWHCVAGQAGTGLMLAASALSGHSFGLTMTLLCLTGLLSYSWPPPFWELPTLTLAASAAAASVGFINTFANLAGYLGNHLVGWIRHQGAAESSVLLFLAGWYLLSAGVVSFVKVKRSE